MASFAPPKAQWQAIGEIMTDLRSMYDSPQLSDVTFVCKDGGRVQASRLFLSARSSMLREMLTSNGMAESNKAEISLEAVSAPVMRSVLEYLYTGAIGALTWNLALEVIIAARFFLLESLEESVWVSLRGASSVSGEIMAEEVASRLTEALTFPDLWDSSWKEILQTLVRVLDSGCVYHYMVHLRRLSHQAFEYYMEQTQADYENTTACSIATYLRFRQIILWCAGQLMPQQDNVMCKLLPVGAWSLKDAVEAPDRDMGARGSSSKLDVETQQAMAASLEPWLTRVNLRRLHPALFVTVVKPLNILPRRVEKQLMNHYLWERARDVRGEEWECGLDHKAHGSSMMLCNKVENAFGLYTTVRVCGNLDIQKQIGRDIHFDVVDFTKVRRFCINKHTLFIQFKELLAREIGIPVNCQRFLVWAMRINKTYRPSAFLNHEEESKTVHELWKTHRCPGQPKALKASSNLFLDVDTSQHGVPTPLAPIGECDIVLILKFYCPETEELRYVGKIYVSTRDKPRDLRHKLNNLAGLSMDDSIILYEEVFVSRAKMICNEIDQDKTFKHNQIEMGDAICYQKVVSAAEKKQLRLPTVPQALWIYYNVAKACCLISNTHGMV